MEKKHNDNKIKNKKKDDLSKALKENIKRRKIQNLLRKKENN